MSITLQNYLKTYRKRGGLTQDEMAYLLGCQDGAKVSRYERMTRQPNLETALGCQAVFGVPVHELFPGIYKEVEKIIIPRAQQLSLQVKNEIPSPYTDRKLETLQSITSLKAGEPVLAI
jgi:transcriptional regulator with XRE-family HTH domain